MNLSITKRLALTFALLTALVFVPSGLALYLTISSAIASENARRIEAAVRRLAYTALHRWGEDLLIDFRGGTEPLEQLRVNAASWVLTRGDGTLIRAQGIFENAEAAVIPGPSVLVEREEKTYRTASVPLVDSEEENFDDLPPIVQEAVRREYPDGIFLRARREGEGGVNTIEVAVLQDDHIRELALTDEGRVLQGDTDDLDTPVAMPADLLAIVTAGMGARELRFSSWKAHNGQLLAIVTGIDDRGEEIEVGVNRLGERFVLDEGGNVVEPDRESRLWVVAVADATTEVVTRARVLTALCVGVPLIWFAVVLVGWYVTRRALSPVDRIVETVERIEVSRLAERLPVSQVHDELHRISGTINRMLDRLAEGYRRERQFTGDASHELRSPIAKVIADVDLALSQDREKEEYRKTLVRCRDYALSMQRIVDSLLLLARLDDRTSRSDDSSFEVVDLAVDTISAFGADEASRIRFHVDESEHALNGVGDRTLIGIMLHNLIQNALRYSPTEEPVAVCVVADNGHVVVRVEDRGDGIPDDQTRRVFRRFYRVEKSRSRQSGGAGLGLSIVDQIARVHGIEISLKRAASGGTVAEFSLPLPGSPGAEGAG